MCWTSRLKIHHFVFSHSHVAVNDDSPGGKTQIQISSGLGDDIFPVILIASVFFARKDARYLSAVFIDCQLKSFPYCCGFTLKALNWWTACWLLFWSCGHRKCIVLSMPGTHLPSFIKMCLQSKTTVISTIFWHWIRLAANTLVGVMDTGGAVWKSCRWQAATSQWGYQLPFPQ